MPGPCGHSVRYGHCGRAGTHCHAAGPPGGGPRPGHGCPVTAGPAVGAGPGSARQARPSGTVLLAGRRPGATVNLAGTYSDKPSPRRAAGGPGRGTGPHPGVSPESERMNPKGC
eukprot:333761-Hanusia_phi.AAC.2